MRGQAQTPLQISIVIVNLTAALPWTLYSLNKLAKFLDKILSRRQSLPEFRVELLLFLVGLFALTN